MGKIGKLLVKVLKALVAEAILKEALKQKQEG